ncbi:hypothetical protein LBMAG57_29740 [Verrucomicrobiota bacterium]|nr:hypothetical protein LBMAG57_29740 [Verrucomicrobiota bacterium]
MELQERLKIFFERLRTAPPCANAEEALALVCRLIEEVEEEFCAVPREASPPKRRIGRMYPPQADSITFAEGGTIQAITSGHLIYCCADGRILIEHIRSGRVELLKLAAKL